MISSSFSSTSYLQQKKKNPSGVDGYGSIEATPLVLMGDEEDNNAELFVHNQPRRSSSKIIMLVAIGSLLILGTAMYLPGAGSSSSLLRSSSDTSLTSLFPMLGKSKLTAEEKLAAKQAKQDAKEAKKLATAQAKQAKKDAKANAKAEKDKAKEAKQQAKEAAKFHPSPYPGCLEVNVTYVATPLSFEAHEIAATAAGCHLASIHSIRENTKLARAGLFELSSGPEIASTFTSGALLAKDYYLGGKVMGGNWTWADGSDWDFGVRLPDRV